MAGARVDAPEGQDSPEGTPAARVAVAPESGAAARFFHGRPAKDWVAVRAEARNRLRLALGLSLSGVQ